MNTKRQQRFPVFPPRGKQRGFAALLLTLALLFGVTIITLTTAKTVLVEQRMSGNELRTEQAFEAAEAGLERGLDYLASGGLDQDNNNAIDTLAGVTLANGARYVVTFNAAGATASSVQVLANGWSDDSVAFQQVSQNLNKGPSLADPPNNPLITKGTCDINGSGDVTNPEANTTVWSGGVVTMTNNNFKTNIPHPNPDPSSSCYSEEFGCLIESSNRDYLGVDVIDQDPSLSSLSDDLYFKNFFGKLPDDYLDQHVSLELAAADVGDAAGKNGEVIWVDGDTTMTGNTVIGARPDTPSIVIINGNLGGAGTVTINGLLYIRGNFTAAGNYTVYGAVIVEGNNANTGSLDIIFDSQLLSNANFTGKMSVVAGTWRDWN